MLTVEIAIEKDSEQPQQLSLLWLLLYCILYYARMKPIRIVNRYLRRGYAYEKSEDYNSSGRT